MLGVSVVPSLLILFFRNKFWLIAAGKCTYVLLTPSCSLVSFLPPAAPDDAQNPISHSRTCKASASSLIFSLVSARQLINWLSALSFSQFPAAEIDSAFCFSSTEPGCLSLRSGEAACIMKLPSYSGAVDINQLLTRAVCSLHFSIA